MTATINDLGDLDYAALDPGIRETVRRLRAAGFNTTDSGDGVTKFATGTDLGESLDFPHVVVITTGDAVIGEARRLADFVTAAGFCVEPIHASSISVQAMFDPIDDTGVIMLTGVTDAAWPPSAAAELAPAPAP